MKTLLSGLLLLATIVLPAQNVIYLSYDNAGNRVERQVIYLSPSPSLRSPEKTTAIEEAIAKQKIRIYPNPTQGILSVEIPDFSDDIQADFAVADLNGKIIVRQQAVSAFSTFDLSKHPNGIYLLRITMNGETETWKIIKK